VLPLGMPGFSPAEKRIAIQLMKIIRVKLVRKFV